MDVYIRKTSQGSTALLASKPNYAGFIVIALGTCGLNQRKSLIMHAALAELLDGACYHDLTLMKNPTTDYEHWRKADIFALTRKDWQGFLENRGYRSGVGHLMMKHYRFGLKKRTV